MVLTSYESTKGAGEKSVSAIYSLVSKRTKYRLRTQQEQHRQTKGFALDMVIMCL